jgi:hypothetical protein
LRRQLVGAHAGAKPARHSATSPLSPPAVSSSKGFSCEWLGGKGSSAETSGPPFPIPLRAANRAPLHGKRGAAQEKPTPKPSGHRLSRLPSLLGVDPPAAAPVARRRAHRARPPPSGKGNGKTKPKKGSHHPAQSRPSAHLLQPIDTTSCVPLSTRYIM